MTMKEYLEIDKFINSKIEQLLSLKKLEDKVKIRNTDMKNILTKIKDLESQIESEIDKLFVMKKEVMAMIREVNNIEYQTLLELRYLCFKPWEQIAVEMGYVYKLHNRALERCKINQKLASKRQ